ncbi:MAG: SDR family NAD(P)-dependent oxidoreductase, partial [bacterium]
LVAKRGQLMQDLPAGAMLSVPLPRAELEPLLDGQIDIAAVNEIKSCVVSGTFEAISAFEKTLQEKGITGRRLMTSHAFHSAMMDGILDDFTTAVGEIELHKPEIPYISNVTGAWITTEQATDPAYYAKHLRQAVLFADGVKTLLEAPNRVLLEVGPGRTLATLAKRQITRASHQQVLHTLRHPQVTEHDRKFILQTLGLLWLAGCDIPPGPPSKGGIDWHGFYKDEKRRRVPLPAYPFERQRYWIEPGDALSQRNGRNTSLQKKPDITDWFYVPTWKRSASISDFGMRNAEWKNQLTPNFEIQNPHSGRWLIFVDANGLGTRLAERLKENRQNVIIVQQGDAFKETAPGVYCIDSHKRKDYFALVNRLAGQEELPNRIVHLWSVQATNAHLLDSAKHDVAQQHGFYSLLYLTQALTDVQASHQMHLAAVTGNVFEVTGDEQLVPEGATITGLCKVIPLEYPHITCRNIDVVVPESGQWPARLVENIIHEHVQDSSDAVVAYRGKHRWVQSFEPVRLLEKAGPPARLRKNGVYLITGGPGGVGLEIAFYLAEAVQAKVVLVGRAQLPQRSTWEKWLTEHDGNDATARKIKKVQVIEAAGGEVIAVSADVSNMKQMQAAINQAEKRFGTIHGVIHAAGVGGGGVIQRQSRGNIAAVFAPKIYGTRVLDALFREKNLDFMVLCSSLLSINGYPGRAEYAAANHFLDSFAHSRNSDDGTYTVSINWDNWREVGMGVDYLQREVEDGMLSREGVEAFKRVLDCDCPQVAVSMYDLNAMNIVQNVDRANGRPEQKTKTETPSAKHPRPALASAYVAPRSEIEKTLADAWCETLGIDKIGVHDNFFELGGDSVLMIQIIALVGKKGLRLSANQVFDHPTVAELAQVVGYGQGSTAEQGLVSGELPLTPIQHWFFEQNFPEPQHFNLPMLLELQQPAAFSLLEQAV